MINIPEVKIGLVAVSRNCFPMSLSDSRKNCVIDETKKIGLDVIAAKTFVENEVDAMKALDEIKDGGANALVVYLGNFGPEGPETLLAQKFDGPVMFVAAAEETGKNLIDGRGDAYCGRVWAKVNIIYTK